MRREDRRLVGTILLAIGLTTLAPPDPGRLLLAGRYVPAGADEILAGFLLAAIGGGLLVRSRGSQDPDSAG